MDVIDRDGILGLVDEMSGWPCVSLYLPVHRAPTGAAADRIALRDLVDEARGRLEEYGARDADARALLAGAAELAGPDGPWDGGYEGLAVFSSPKGTSVVRLDDPVPARVVVADAPYIRPLLPSLHGDRRFWALALDENEVHLYHAKGATFYEVALPAGTPLSMRDELRYDQREESLQFMTVHVASGPAGGGSQAAYHGHGGEKDAHASDVARFVGDVENAVTTAIGPDLGEPLVLMGVDRVLDAYRHANSYSPLADQQITGSVGHLSKPQVRALAASALEPVWAAELAREFESLGAKESAGLASRDIPEIAVAAAEGRVATLFADDGTGPWGILDRVDMRATQVCRAEPERLRQGVPPGDASADGCGWDLVDLAAVETLRHGGDVRGFSGEDAPVSGAAAILRY